MGTTSFYSAIAGMSANRQAIDVIGNNLANLNTIGFKKSTVTFADVFSASLANAVNGAGNPLEIGLGSRVAGIDQVFSQGSLRSSGNATDMAIQGAGFFTVETPDGTRAYTRAGRFSFSKDGDLVSPDGSKVFGYEANALGEIQYGNDISAINISTQVSSAPVATTEVFMSTLLDADADPDSESGEFSTPIRVFDSLGVPHTLHYIFRRVDPAVNGAVEWAFDIRVDSTEVLDNGAAIAGAAEGTMWSLLDGALIDENNDSIAAGNFNGSMAFDANGALTTVSFAGAATELNGLGAAGVFDIANGVDITGLTLPPNTAGVGVGGGAGDFTFSSGANDMLFDWNVVNDDGSTNLVSYASDAGSSTSSVNQDGYGVGVLSSLIIDPDGTVTGLFSNGDVRNLAQVALANFNNPQGLLAVGNNLFVQTPGSGQPSIGQPESGGRGSVSGSTLELSNVDLAEEFTNLIISERGFQANSKVITTNSQLLQEAVNLVR